jgi:hypothetical protein
LPDGTLLKVEMPTASPEGYIGLCKPCRTPLIPLFRRRRPSCGLTTLARLAFCVDCGRLCCPRHRALSSWDRQWRCHPCAIKHAIKQLLGYLIFTRD